MKQGGWEGHLRATLYADDDCWVGTLLPAWTVEGKRQWAFWSRGATSPAWEFRVKLDDARCLVEQMLGGG